MMQWIFSFLSLLFNLSTSSVDTNIISIFPLDHYDQKIAHWIKPDNSNYDKPLLTHDIQQRHWRIFNKHYFGSLSPWNAEYVKQIISQKAPDDLKTIEQDIIAAYNNNHKPLKQIGYGTNFRPHSSTWITRIANNINLSQFDHLQYRADYRAIAIDNLAVRVLPTEDVAFYSYKLAGEGYPFDNLQMSSLWVGTPVYILTTTKNRAWSLVISPDYIGWVKSGGLARTNDHFINVWVHAAQKQLAAITRTQTSLLDAHGQLLVTAYVGSVFPMMENKLMVPVTDIHQLAQIQWISIPKNDVVTMPFLPTPHHIAQVMQTLIHRPYGWGNLYFYNDCSSELKNLLAPFGIWLPRHSADQVYMGKLVDLSTTSKEQRLSYLESSGHPFTTIVYTGGHVIMYIGNYPNPNSLNHELMAMTYQNVWGLKPTPPTRRAIIGKAVLFPLLLQYPEDTTLVSMAGKKYFQVSFLDEAPNNPLKINTLDLRDLMTP